MSNEYVKREKITETRWKCPSCALDNRGRDMKCVGCGAPKDESSSYVVDLEAEAIVDEAQLADARAGEHWVCSFCEKENRGRILICRFCGADQNERREKKKPAPAPLPVEKKKPSLLLGCGVLLGLFALLFAFFYWVGIKDRVQATVSELSWEQDTRLHARTLAHHEGWRDEMPAGAFDTRCERKQRTTRQVVDHYRSVTKTRSVRYQSGSREECRDVTTNLENGYASTKTVCKSVPEYDYRDETYTEQEPVYRSEPVYDERCRYAVYEWPVVKTASRSGQGREGYAWAPTGELGVDSCTPCEQKNDVLEQCCSREGRYSIVFTRDEKSDDAEKAGPFTYVTKDLKEYESFEPGSEHTLDLDGESVSVIRD